ncbi:FR47-like protein [Nesidiocoris tenuis]|uniref:FR47-like protein n=1 Tax=Nesidiocoris tenuis TaxID=355587 RepID=A0ABN7BAW6_9HEMI|nr:FR47-like protein [Nesidiocoris tenuis]
MEVAGEGRNFRLVPNEDLPAIQEFLSSFLPYSLKFHQTIVTYLRDRVWEFHFYVAKSWPEDPIILHFPGQTCTPLGLVNESFTVFCPPERMDTLELLRTEDVLIDWSKTFFLNFTHSEIIETIALWPFVGRVERTHCDIYILKEPPPDDIQLGEMQGVDCEVRELQPEHASIIHNLYPAKEMESVEVFRRLINKLPAYGVFSQGELAAWMMQSYYGAMFSMQTRPEFRRKGFGIHLAQALTKKVRSRGYIPFVMIRPENDASLGLYHKLGYVKSYSSTRAVFYVKDEASEKEANSKEEKEVEESKEEGDNETTATSKQKDLETDQGKGVE